MTYTRTYSYYRDGESGTIYEIYEQPVFDRAKYLVYLVWWKVCWKFKPLAWFIDHPLETTALWFHRRKCNDNCTTGRVWRRDRDGDSDGQLETYCGRLPIDPSMDCMLHLLDRKNNTVLHNTRLRSSVD